MGREDGMSGRVDGRIERGREGGRGEREWAGKEGKKEGQGWEFIRKVKEAIRWTSWTLTLSMMSLQALDQLMCLTRNETACACEAYMLR